MEESYSNVLNELIETKKQYLADVEQELLLLGMYSDLSSKRSPIDLEQKNVNLTEVKIKLLKVYENYCEDIEFEMNLIAEFISQNEKIERLQKIIDEEIKNEEKIKKQYDNLANSKLGKLQKLWWRVVKKFRKG